MRLLFLLMICVVLSSCIEIVKTSSVDVPIEEPTAAVVYDTVIKAKDVVVSTKQHPAPKEPVVAEVSVKRVSDIPFVKISIEVLEFSNKSIEIEPGTMVIWQNVDEISKQISGPGFESSILRYGEDFRHTFYEPGRYSYGDRLHPRIRGEIIVADHSGLIMHPEETHDRKYVDIDDYSFSPKKIEIVEGGIVTWTNRDELESHTVSGAGFDSGVIRPGEVFVHQFDRSGIYPYSNTIHPSMIGEIVVKDYVKR